MEVDYKNKKLEALCTDRKKAVSKYSEQMADKIQCRIDQIRSSESLENMVTFRIGGCHILKGDRKEQYAMDLVGGNRLVFVKKDESIKIVTITEIVDYH